MKLLVSVRSVDEALLAAKAGADFIDCKEPHAGALGALPLEILRTVVAAMHERYPGRPISATVGDFAADARDPVLERVAATAACGVDYVKVGVLPGARLLLDALAQSGATVVPVFIADTGLNEALLARACEHDFPALMLDTADKARGSLFDVLDEAALQRFVLRVRAAGKQSGLAGALRRQHLPHLAALAPDFAGFRSAVCDGARTEALSVPRLRELRAALGASQADVPLDQTRSISL
ncbi:(5-formylfuran-3-yl)methyl phosphate synthase [Methylibium sp.]|uniref:(5-formylfuran-3-yl)methyl phosphate synthase n=1 Tax=Methylibium sp. TaxID=2067992 RepID=UPI0017B05C2D|nr:(5-formylfuran-3-yl)methyl phosphate synthase [Methylibium sp.]MBA3588975.1 (5-formylfuran-3-yl)methyl phosphate synthase [Methylibium sp.]